MEVDWLETHTEPSADLGLDPTLLTSIRLSEVIRQPHLEDSGPVTNNYTQFDFLKEYFFFEICIIPIFWVKGNIENYSENEWTKGKPVSQS